MNKIVSVILFVLISFSGVAQNKEKRSVNSFNELKVSQGIQVYLFPSTNEEIEIEAENVDLEEVITEVNGSVLRIHLSGNRYRNIDVKIKVYYKSLNEISASSAASVYGEQVLKGNDFVIDVSSAASIELKLDVSSLEIDASSSGDVKVSGKAHDLTIDVSSAGGVNAYELTTELADVDASSAGSAKVNVSKSLKASASSGGSIRYKGSPERSNVDSSSGGSVKKAN